MKSKKPVTYDGTYVIEFLSGAYKGRMAIYFLRAEAERESERLERDGYDIATAGGRRSGDCHIR